MWLENEVGVVSVIESERVRVRVDVVSTHPRAVHLNKNRARCTDKSQRSIEHTSESTLTTSRSKASDSMSE